jgi:hypothetical protein
MHIMKNMLNSIDYVSFSTGVMPILHTHVCIYRNSSPNTGVIFLNSSGLQDERSYGNNVSILLHNVISLSLSHAHTHTFFSAALNVVDDGPCETETCHVVGHEIEVVNREPHEELD